MDDFDYKCEDRNYNGAQMPTSNDQCNDYEHFPKSQARCGGEPYHKDFFRTDSETGFAFLRRKVLFNLYSFDKRSTTSNHVPTLIIKNCEFKYFLKEYDSLIEVENNNFYYEGDDIAGKLLFRGE